MKKNVKRFICGVMVGMLLLSTTVVINASDVEDPKGYIIVPYFTNQVE